MLTLHFNYTELQEHYNAQPEFAQRQPAAFALQDSAVHKMGAAGHFQSAAALSGGGGVAPQIRKDFPETWIWDSLVADSADGVQHFRKPVPDTITSWVISAFSLHPDAGLGLTEQPAKVTVFKAFFVALSLPYSVKRGEVVAVPIVVFNYLPDAANADVTLHNPDGDFEFVELSNEVHEIAGTEASRTKQVAVKSGDGAGVSFMIRPLRVGQLTVKVTAVSALAGDGVELILPVTPEGVPQFVNKAVLVDLRHQTEFAARLTIDVPETAVPHSARAEVSVIGDVLGATVQHLDRLIRMPSGCGEQNMLNFVPNIVVRDYLQQTGQLTEALEQRTRQHLEIGYQRQLTYRHPNGSFSAFGTDDAAGSTWLTAFVARSFGQAAAHIDTIEPRIIGAALDYLTTVQSPNGSFAERGAIIHRQMQGGAAAGVALTAYTLLAFLENRHTHPNHTDTVQRALAFLEQHLDTLDDNPYAMAVAAYALQLAEGNGRAELLRSLDARATETDGLKHWTVGGSQTSSLGTEATAYALLAHFHAGPVEAVVPIMRWLLAQRNAEGGFESTQDTIVGLQALATVAGKLGLAAGSDGELKFALDYCDADGGSEFSVSRANAAVLQQFQVPADVKAVDVTATGSGFGLVSLAYRYYVNETAAAPRFVVQPLVERTEHANALRMTVCTNFIADDADPVSNMAVMEVEFPSGYTFDAGSRDALAATDKVKRVETRNGDTLLVLYFDSLGADPVCPVVEAVRSHLVAYQKPAAVTVYDYYDTSEFAVRRRWGNTLS